MKNLKNFLLCGFAGWCIEVFWTGFHSMLNHDRTLKGTSSLIMFPIYGAAAIISPLSQHMKNINILFRGLCYATCITSAELLSGTILKKHQACPWDYSSAKLNYKGVIRLDYFPLWFLVGLFYEKILSET